MSEITLNDVIKNLVKKHFTGLEHVKEYDCGIVSFYKEIGEYHNIEIDFRVDSSNPDLINSKITLNDCNIGLELIEEEGWHVSKIESLIIKMKSDFQHTFLYSFNSILGE